MKKFMSVIIIMILLCSASAFAVDQQLVEEQVSTWDRISDFFGSFTLAVTDITDVDDIERGAVLDVYYNFKATREGETFKITPCFNVPGHGDICMNTLSGSTSKNIGDVWKVRITNLDTTLIPMDACGDYIKLSGIHYACDSNKENCVRDQIQARTSEQDNTNFILLCSELTDCDAVDNTGEYKCDTTSIATREILKTGYISDTCYEGFKSIVCKENEKCNAVTGTCDVTGNGEVPPVPTPIPGDFSDSDGDGVIDSLDKCPMKAGRDGNGCPLLMDNDCIPGEVDIGICPDESVYPIDCIEGEWAIVNEDDVCSGGCVGDSCSKVCENTYRHCGGECDKCGLWDKIVTWLRNFVG